MSVRDLWASVALQACYDVESMDYASLEYSHAVSFFCDPGEWAKSRQTIADFIELHVNDLERVGRTLIAARHLRDGVPPKPVPHPRLPPAQPKVLPVVLVIPPVKPQRQPRVVHNRNWWIQKFMAKIAPP